MAPPETSAELFADARNRMVDSQVRPNRVTDPRILAAMRRLPRERFLPPGLSARWPMPTRTCRWGTAAC